MAIKLITRIIPAAAMLTLPSVALGQELTCEGLDLLAEGTVEVRDYLLDTECN